jgi:TRAP-type mannitol/chloroaromatic compound transport system permease small subunit
MHARSANERKRLDGQRMEHSTRGWLRLAVAIDRLTLLVGRIVSILALVMVLLGAGNAILRYLGRFVGRSLASNAFLEAQWYLFSVIFLLGAPWALQLDAHVRVDVLFAKLTDRARSWINIIGSLVLLLPFCAFAIWTAWPVVRNSWSIHEVSPDPGGLPRYPLKALVLVCFALLALQGISELIKEVHKLRSHAGDAYHDHHVEGV